LPRLAVQISVAVLASTGPQDQVQERVHRDAIQIVEVDATHPGAKPHRLQARRQVRRGPRRRDEEHQVGIDQLTHERRRRRVEELEIVDEEDKGAVGGLGSEHRPNLGHDRDQIAFVGHGRGEEVSEGAERRGLGSFRRRGPGDVAAGAIGRRKAGVGQAGLADAS
jgi:hypothetical protein